MDKIFDYSKELCACEVAKLKSALWLVMLATLLKCTRNCVARILLVRAQRRDLAAACASFAADLHISGKRSISSSTKLRRNMIITSQPEWKPCHYLG